MRGRGSSVFLVAVVMLSAVSAEAETPVVVGEHVTERFETPHPYPSSGAAQPMLTWVDEIGFPGATYIAVHFERFELAPGDYVVVRSPDGEQSWTYTRFGRHDLGITPEGFFATHIKGDAAVVELYTAGFSEGWGYAIDKYGRGYNDDEIAWFWSQGLGEEMNLPRPLGDLESLCGADDTDEAKCYQTSEPEVYEESRAVARLLYNGNAHCTGWLVGSAGHVMTNQHCIGSQTQLNSIDFEFMAEGPDCATSCATTLGCPGTIEASGGTMVQVDAPLDYALVIPDTATAFGTDLPATYGYMKLRATGAVLNERVYHPQHPAGWGKRIGVFSTHTVDVGLGGYNYASSLNEPPCSGGPGDVGYYTDTQGGSSGSPVLGYSDHKVVALHHCRGAIACTGTGGDPNRGVPIDAVIASLGANVPPGALCDPYVGPTTLTATVVGDNRIDLVWDAVAGAGITYTVKRAVGACPQPSYATIAEGLTVTAYSDTTVSGGITYAYIVVAVNDEDCESDPSPCDEALATGPCIEPPTFAGLEALVNPQHDDCSLELDWADAIPFCGTAVTYNVYRSETPGFTPGPANLVASCLNQTSYIDSAVETQTFYSYIVRAEDDTPHGSGPCNSGNEDTNVVELTAAPTGPDVLFFAEDFEADDGGLVGTRDWEWGDVYTWSAAGCNSTPAPPPAPHSGVGMWGTVLNTCYHDLGNNTGYDTCNNTAPADDSILSFQVDLTGTGAAQMCWWEWPDLYLYWDWGQVTANGDVVFEHCGGSYSAPTQWTQQCVDLGAYAGQMVTVEFHMMASTVVNRAGWYIDDLEVFHGSDCTTGVLFADDFESGGTGAWSLTTPLP
ncbi:MAG TPA: serine protease [Methylomirabilota bacterium]|nr:serine protease [Methylomirabilota bacterium]